MHFVYIVTYLGKLLVIKWEINSLREVVHLQHFHNTFTINYRWYIDINSNLNSQLKVLFYPPITTNNNLRLKICCESIVDIAFLIV